MSCNDAVDLNSTLLRRGQRHPNLLATMVLPFTAKEQLKRARHRLSEVSAIPVQAPPVPAGEPSPEFEKLQRSLDGIVEALDTLVNIANTPDAQLKVISKITGGMREIVVAQVDAPAVGHKLQSFRDIIAEEFVIPLLFDSRVRYLHRALMTLLRQAWVFTDASLKRVEEIFLRTFVSPWKVDPITNLPCIFTMLYQAEETALHAEALPLNMEASKQDVLCFLNSIDCLGATLMPVAPGVFEHTLLETLSLLADCLCWCVNNAVLHRRLITSDQEDDENHNTTDEGAVFGEDLDYVRFCVRVVATYTHKYLHNLHALLQSHSTTDADEVHRGRQGTLRALFTRLLRPVFLMLSSALFPKDVLNACGLLLASMVTVSGCEPWHLNAVCCVVCTEVNDTVSPIDHWVLPQEVYSFAYAPDSRIGQQSDESAHALKRLFGSLTNNGRFAFLKGLLAHLSRPIYGKPDTIGILLRPVAVFPKNAQQGDKSSENDASEGEVVVYDVIVPFAEKFCSAIQEPETRFMAIQTMDSVVRHAAACFSFMKNWFHAQAGSSTKNSNHTSDVAVLAVDSMSCRRKKERLEKDLPGSRNINCMTPPKGDLISYDNKEVFSVFQTCSLFGAKLGHTLHGVTQLIMGLWDDGTQSMSGPLYETYDQVLLVKEQFRSARRIFHPPLLNLPDGRNNTDDVFMDSLETLLRVLAIQSDRRARYHALLGIFSVIPVGKILEMLDQFYIKNIGAAPALFPEENSLTLAHEPALVCFAESLLSGASNHKVGNISGDVFVKLACLLSPRSVEADRVSTYSDLFLKNLPELFYRGLISPLSRAIAMEGYVRVVANVNESVNISNLIAHFVVPLLKQVNGALPVLIKSLMKLREAPGTARERVYQGVVEVLNRARDAGLDITTFTAASSETFSIVKESLQSWSFDLRITAFRLCVLAPKRLGLIELWQCKVVESFLSLNMHLGGDGIARKGLLDSYRKWAVQVAESFKRGSNRLGVTSCSNRRIEGKESAAKDEDVSYRQMIVNHCISCARLFAEHYGSTVEQSQDLSIERRTTAASCFNILLSELTSLIQADVSQTWWLPRLRELFPSSILRPLLADLSDGWVFARKCAKKLLAFYFQHAFSIIREVVDPESILNSSISELRCAFSYRNAEGAVACYMLFDSQTPEARWAAVADPGKELQRRLEKLLTEVDALFSMCNEIQALCENGIDVSACDFVRQHPLHGRLSLCMEMLSSTVSLFHASSDPKTPHTETSLTLREASNKLLKCSSGVLRTCSALVGSEPLVWSALNFNEPKKETISPHPMEVTSSVVVDCRGHVYDTNRSPEAEGLMRIVVNNTWLAIRNATLAVHLITAELHDLHQLDFGVVRMIGFDLIDTLLSTKHNGVMRCVQDALRGLSEALLRCREPLFYRLPREMADYLMGEVGVMSSDSARMLRRSQGLPHAILSILDAEVSSSSCFIFPIVMARLLALVREGSLPQTGVMKNAETPTEVQLSRRSNSLNVLKFIFDDRNLAERAIPHLEEVFLVATEGFSDPNWGIRNSSLMLFSSVLQRFVGEHPSTGGVGVNTSLHDIARRTPRAVTFALKVLSQSSTSPRTSEPVLLEDTSNLSIFPVLQMLSMLSPDPADLLNETHARFHVSQEDGRKDTNAERVSESKNVMEPIVHAVMHCGADRCLAVRTASARALVCVVPCAAVVARLKQIAALHLNSRDGTANRIHGCLEQLHRFYEHYVGTVRRHQRPGRLSGRATPALAAAVTQTLAGILLDNRNILGRLSIVCPTVSAAFFELMSDLAYFGPQNDLCRKVLKELLAWGMSILERNICSPSPAYERVKADHGGVRRAGALCLLLTARLLHLHPSDQGSTEHEAKIRSAIERVLAQEVSNLDLASGLYNITSLLLSHVHFYTTVRRLFPREKGMMLVTEGLQAAFGIDLASASLQALTKALVQHRSGHALGCVAWEEVMAHLEFAVALLRRIPFETSGAFGVACETIQDCLLEIVNLDNLHLGSKAWRHPPEFCGAALLFLVYRSLQKERVLPEGIAKILSSYAEAERPLIVRKAVLEALSDYFEAISAWQGRQQPAKEGIFRPAEEPRGGTAHRVGPFLLVFLRLLCDDAAEVRDAACRVCPLILHTCAVSEMWEVEAAFHFFVQDQTSSLLSVVLVLRRLYRENKVSLHEVEAYLLSDNTLNLPLPGVKCDAGAPVEGLGVSEADDKDIEDDALFHKEPNNIFLEGTTLNYILKCIQGELSSQFTLTDAESMRYETYDELLSSAESAKSLKVEIISSLSR